MLRAGGDLYVEVPSQHTPYLPTGDIVREQGYPIIASNFWEDGTHINARSIDEIAQDAEDTGFVTLATGYITSPFIEDSMLALGRELSDPELVTYAYWSKLLWAQYAIFRKPNEMSSFIEGLSE